MFTISSRWFKRRNIDGEKQNAAFFSEGQLVFTGSGNLAINALCDSSHGMNSDYYVEINHCNITIIGALRDGIHANDGFFMNGGALNITSQSDGIDAGIVEIVDGNLTIHNSQNNDDVDAIREEAVNVEYVSAVVRSGGQVIGNGNNWSTIIEGVDPDYLYIRMWEIESGAFFTDKEVRSRKEAVFKPYFHFLHFNSKIALQPFLPYYLIFLLRLLVEYENLIMLFISNKVIRFKELADSHAINVLKIIL